MYRILLLLSFALFFANEKFLVRIPYSGLDQLKTLSSLDLNFDHHRTMTEIHAYASLDKINDLNKLIQEQLETLQKGSANENQRLIADLTAARLELQKQEDEF